MLEFHVIMIKLLKFELFNIILKFYMKLEKNLQDIIKNIQDYKEKINGKENKTNNDIQIDDPNVNKFKFK